MPADYRIITLSGELAESGRADIEVAARPSRHDDAGGLLLTPEQGAVLHIPFGHILEVTEPEPFCVRVTLADGTAIELSRLGVMRTQLLAELSDGRAAAAAFTAGVVGVAECFRYSGGEVRVYDDALLINTERVGYSSIQVVRTAGYAVVVEAAARDTISLSGLGARTGELAGLLTTRLAEARRRTSALLGSLLPELDPMTLRQAAALLRDGVAVPATTLDRVHPGLARLLLVKLTLPGPRVAELTSHAGLAVGFKQRASVRRPAAGVTPWRDHAAPNHIGVHGGYGYGYRYEPGFFAYRTGPGGHRADVTRGLLTPEHEDLDAFTVTGEDPAVLAFARVIRAGQPAYEALNTAHDAAWLSRVCELLHH